MSITLTIDDQVLSRAEGEAARRRQTLGQFVEEVLRSYLESIAEGAAPSTGEG